MEEEEGSERGRSFRYEEYGNRRVFLRSYPLLYHSHWEEEEDEEQAEAEAGESIPISMSKNKNKKSKKKIVVGNMGDLRLKERLVYVVGWGKGKVLLLKKLKRKVSFYLVSSCHHPFGHSFNPTPSLLSV